MGVFDKVVKDAEEAMARDEPGLAQQDGQTGQTGQTGHDMQVAQNMIGKQRGAQDPDQDQDQGSDQDDIGEDW